MLKIEIKIDFEEKSKALKFFKSILPELEEKFKRSETRISQKESQLKVEISATDKSAARASLNSIMKPLILFKELESIE